MQDHHVLIKEGVNWDTHLIYVFAMCCSNLSMLCKYIDVFEGDLKLMSTYWGLATPYGVVYPGQRYFYNTLRARQNGRHFADDPFKRIFLNETLSISIKISPNFVPKGPINTIPSLVQTMAWRRSGDKPLSETMLASLLTHICVTRPQWDNGFPRLFGAKLLPTPMLTCC